MKAVLCSQFSDFSSQTYRWPTGECELSAFTENWEPRTENSFQCFSLIGKMCNRFSISHPSRKTDNTTTSTAIDSPKLRPRRVGSRRRVARLRMLRVAKPKTTAHRMLYTFSRDPR